LKKNEIIIGEIKSGNSGICEYANIRINGNTKDLAANSEWGKAKGKKRKAKGERRKAKSRKRMVPW
jgi:hypothetical protein